jgi:hypothetical protein
MQYRPDIKKNADQFIIGKIVKEIFLNKNISPSILTFDRKISIEIIKEIPPTEKKSEELEFSSLSYLNLEPDKTYLFALADGSCIGFVEVEGNQVIQPDSSSVLLEVFIKKYFGRPFPDYNGIGPE